MNKNKNPVNITIDEVCGAQNRTRTCTAVRPLVPETSVSTNFTIWADGSFIRVMSAQDKTRTCTSLRTPAPQAGVSTNFTTWAKRVQR